MLFISLISMKLQLNFAGETQKIGKRSLLLLGGPQEI